MVVRRNRKGKEGIGQEQTERCLDTEQPQSWMKDNLAALQLISCNCSQRESQDDFLEMDLREGWEGEC